MFEEFSDDPLAFPQHLITTTAIMYSKVRQIQEKIFKDDLANIRKRSKGQMDYDIGDHVLIHYPRSEKILLEWRGPYQIVSKINQVVYTVQELGTKTQFDVHVNRMHLFYPGNLTPEQLTAESARCEEYFIGEVYDHEQRSGEYWFFVKWLGYPDTQR